MNSLLRTSSLTRSVQAGLLSLLLLLGSFSAQGQTNTWTGGTSTDWNTSGNWSLTLVPDVTHDVVIPAAPANQPILSTTATVKSVAVASSATLTINNTGSLDINGSTGFALTNRGTLDNSGTIRIGNLSAVADRGIVHYSGTLYNRPGGLIQIDRTSAVEAFYSEGVVNNEATIEIGTNAPVTGNGISIVGGTFTNSATITINGSTGKGLSIAGGVSFTNNSASTLTINGSTGFALENRGTLDNSGTIRIGNTSAVADRGIVHYSGTLYNRPGGFIQIDRTSAVEAFYSEGVVNNEATIEIGTNAAVTGNGISIVGGTFTNSATITIGTNVTGTAILNGGTISNSARATLTVFAPINNSNSFTNTGLFTVSTTQPHINIGTLVNNGVISYLQGNPIPNVINNDLVVSSFSLCGTASTISLQIGGANSFSVGTTWYTDAALTTAGGTYNAGTNTFTPTSLSVGTNTRYFMAIDNVNSCTQTVSASVTVLARPTPSLVSSGSLNCSQTSVTLTASGGTSYTFANASGTLGTPGSASTLVVSAGGTYSVTVGNANGCTATTTVALASIPTSLTWTGNINTDWNTATNWCPATVPTATNDVVIPSAPANQPIISTTAVAKSVEVLTGASLSISSAGSLTINSNKPVTVTLGGTTSGFNCSFLNKGTVTNEGAWIMDNPSGFGTGIYNLGTINNRLGGSISLSRVSANIENQSGGTFTNSSTLTFGSNGVGTSLAIRNLSGATFVNQGGGCQALGQALIRILSTGTISDAGSFSNTGGTIIESSTGTSGIAFNSGLVQNLNGGTFNITTDLGVLTTGTGLLWCGSVSRDWNTAANWSGGYVPTATDDVVIPPDPANQPILSTTATARAVEVFSGASLSITSAGSLTINEEKRVFVVPTGSSGSYQTTGFYNKGTVSNEGALLIGNTGNRASAGLYNSGTFSNNGGYITIDNGSSGLHNLSGSFVNSGTLICGGIAFVGNNGIQNDATFSNTTGALIILEQAFGGISNQGTFVNSSTITIGISTSIANQGISNLGSFTNTTGGYIAIDRTRNGLLNISFFGSPGIFVNSAIITLSTSVSSTAIGNSSGATFTNQGCPALLQSLGNGIISNAGSFSNTGTIIENASGNSNIGYNGGLIVNNNGGSFTVASGNAAVSAGAGLVWQGCVSTDWNTAGNWYPATVPTATDNAIIQLSAVNQPIISTTAVAKSVNVQTGALLSITNAGRLSIDGSTISGLSNSGTVTNEGNLLIGSLSAVGENAIYNAGSFTNTATGVVQLDRATGNGIWNAAVAGVNMHNSGLIRIGGNAITGVTGILNYGTFTNHPGGQLEVDRPTSSAIVSDSPAGIFTNAAVVRIGQRFSIPGSGIATSTSATVQNLAGASITIDRVGYHGINSASGSTVTNAGTVSIGMSGSVVGNAINNTASFTNLACGVLRVFAPVYNENGIFTNNGFLTVNTLRKPTKTVVRVNSPSGIAGTYVFAAASYGPPINTVNLTADAVLVNDGTANPTQGCFSLASGSLTGKIALVDRGTCGSNEKVYNAQQAGAIAVIMLHDAAGPPPPMSGGIYASQITIPAMSMTQADGAAIKAALTPGPVNISISQEEVISTTLVTNNGVIDYPQGNPIPNVINNDLIVSSFSLCSGASTTALQIGGSNSFSAGTTWYTDAGLSTAGGTYDNGTNTFTPTSLSVGTNTLYFTATDNTNNCVQTVSASVTVLARPTPSLVSSGSLNCSQTSVTLTASGGTSYTFANAIGNFGTPGSASSLVISAGGTYSVTVGNANGCTSTTTTTVLSDTAIPTLTITPAPSLTIGVQSVTLTASGASSYSWSSGASTTAISVSVAGPYTVTGITTGGCTGTATVNVVSLTEVAGITVGAVGLPVDVNGGDVQANDLFIFSFVLTNTGNDPTRFQIPNMATITGPGVIGGTLPNDQTNTAPSNGQLQYSTDNGTNWTNVGAGGTTTPSVSVNGTVRVRVPMTVQPGAQPNDVITLRLGNTPGDAQNVLRSNDGGDVYTVDNADGAVVGELLGSPSNGVREASFTQSLTVLVTPPPSITAQPASASSVCVGASVMVTVGVSGSISGYQWLKDGSPVPGQTGLVLSLSNVQASNGGVYSLSVMGPYTSTTSTSFSLTVNDLPSVTVTASSSTTLSCPNPSLTLIAQTSATVFAWSSGGSTSQSLSVNQQGIYSVTVTNGNGCTAVSNSLTVSADQSPPIVSVSAVSSVVTCTNPSLTLTATSSVTALRWSTGATTASISVTAAGTYSVTATGANSCTAVSNSLSISQNLTLPPFSVNSVSTCTGRAVSLLASGCSGQVVWSTGATGSSLTLTAGNSTSVLTATCTVGSCSTTASGSVVVGQVLPPAAQILSLSTDESTCPVRLVGRAIGTSFVFTNTQGYVFSHVYRQPGTYEVTGLAVKQSGVYTLTATYTNECGTSVPVSQTVTVSRSCP